MDDIPSAPTHIDGSLADKICRLWDEYLPDVDDVVGAILDMED